MDQFGSLASPMNAASTDTIFGTNAGTGAALPGQEKTLTDTIISWAKENPVLATGIVGAAGTAVAGIGSAMLNKSALEEKIQADKDLVSQKFNQETEGRRQFVQGNPSVFNWQRRFKPTGQPLNRLSTGQPVYSGGGLINRAMRGG